MGKKNASKATTETVTEPPAAADPPTDASPTEKKHRRGSSSATNVLKPEELKAFLGEDKDLVISKEVSRLNWKMNTSPGSLDDAKQLKDIPISNPPVRKMQIFFGTGIHVTARAPPSSKVGVSVHDVLTAIYKLYKKKADDELELPVLADIEWGRGDDMKAASEDWPAVALAVLKKEQAPTGKKGKK